MQTGLDFNLVEELVAGVDEVGRGPLCGPVVTAAVILDPRRPIAGLNDSKKLTEARREALFDEICEKALAWCVARAEVDEIDRLNILHATMLAMRRAVEGLRLLPQLYAMYNPMPYAGACEMEVELAIGLREAGYGVWQA